MASGIAEATAADRAAIGALLAANALPTDDIATAPLRFLVAREDDALVGVVGLERHGEAALLRSLAVRADRRGHGLGDALLRAAERAARRGGIGELVLLTTTAAPFFAARGYRPIDREAVPAALRDSAEVRSLCPASATVMRKALPAPRRFLFVCVENSNRSQMAEAFARLHGGDDVEAYSAGSRPSGRINPKAIRFMAERGVDLAGQSSKSLDDLAALEFEAVVTMGCGDACPWVPARRREDWALADPREMDDAGYREVRDDIEARVRALLAS